MSETNVVCNNVNYGAPVWVFDERDTISRTVIQGQEWEPHICEIMAGLYKPGTDVLDIGANLGLNSIGMHKRAGVTGTMHLFEPQHDVFTMCQFNTRHMPCKLYNICLSDRPTVLQFSRDKTNIGGTHMLGTGGSVGGARIEDLPTNAVSVAALPLDSVLDRKNINRISVAKIDVEGAEVAVLQGARETLRAHAPALVIEAWRWNTGATFAALDAMGYRLERHIKDDDYVFVPK